MANSATVTDSVDESFIGGMEMEAFLRAGRVQVSWCHKKREFLTTFYFALSDSSIICQYVFVKRSKDGDSRCDESNY